MKLTNREIWAYLKGVFASRLSLTEDKADDAVIDEGLRAGVEMRGTNLWVLMFAIFIASIGLNVNSTAVIIGAMLISPLMGPILGAGYGIGINDFALIRRSLKNLAIATGIALMTSTVYFLVTPLTAVQSELLARTTPSIWDVLIAFFGGLAGIVAATRKEKSNVIPGVAIATALMPPLCTAGYGLATGSWSFFFGAFYLFFINSVFIALSATLIIRAFHVQQKQFIDEATAARVRRYISITVILAVIPSLYLAVRLVQAEVFKARAATFVKQELNLSQTHVAAYQVDAAKRQIEVTLIGETLPKERLTEIAGKLPTEGLKDAQLKINQADNQKVDLTSLKASLLGDLYQKSQEAIEEKEKALAAARAELSARTERAARLEGIPEELVTLYPQIQHMYLASVPGWSAASGREPKETIVLSVRTTRPLATGERKRIEAWLAKRLDEERVKLIVEIARP